MTPNGEDDSLRKHDPDLRRFAEHLTHLRLSLKLSRAALAHQIGASPKALEHWEEETGNPPIRFIVRLARYFGLTTDALLRFELDAEEESTRIELLKRLLREVEKHELRLADLEADLARDREEGDRRAAQRRASL